MHRRLASLAIAGVIVAPGLGLAADVELASRIDRVTVFPDAAVVTRMAALDLPAGASALVLRGLPASLDPASIRVEGEGSSGFAIGGIDVRATPGEAKPVIDAELERRLKALRDERESVQGRIAATQGKKAAIERYAQASPEKLGPEAKPLDVGQWQVAWEAIGSGLSTVNEELRALGARARDLDAEIAALERARPQPIRPGAPRRDVVVAVETAAAVKGGLRVSYRVAGAGWAPLYDARLETGAKEAKPALELVRRAQVQQRTGEDWSDVALSVSTVRINRGATAPDLPPLQVAFYEPPPPIAAGRPAPMSRSMESRDQLRAEAPAAAAPALAKAEEVQASVEATAFQATFAVPGRVTVPQDATKSFVLGKRSLAPALLVKAAPVVDETAYLEASFVNDDEAPLLPGEVAIHRDGAYVGKARLKLTAPGDTVELGFGADDKVKVTRVPLRRRENEPSWIGQTKTDLREFKTTVKNLHAQPIRITVVDRLPFSENAAIQVEQLRETTPPTEKQVGDKRGVMAWSWDYAPGEQKEIRLAYRLKWPADRDVTFEPKPIAPPRS
ncbi:MAG: mucoidy inhibitor MuiA family protein [Microvirga sp.]